MVLTGCAHQGTTSDAAPVVLPHTAQDSASTATTVHSSAPSSATPSRTANPVLLAGLTIGPKPKIAWIRGTHLNFLTGGNYRLHRADGTTLVLPHSTMTRWAPIGRGVIGEVGTESGPVIDIVSGDGHVTTSMPRHFGLAVSPDRRIIGWLRAPNMTPHIVVDDGGTGAFDFSSVGHGTTVGAIWGTRTCKEQASEGGGCTVFVNAPKTHQVWITDSHGIVETVGPMQSVTDVDPSGRVIGLSGSTADRRCFGMWRPNGQRVWRTCHSHLTAFSPDSRHVLGLGPSTSPFSFRHIISLYDDTGHRLAAYSVPGLDSQLADVTWEDSRHVLATVFEMSPGSPCPEVCAGHWAVVRIGIGGSMELALPMVTGTISFPAYRLPLR